MGIDRADVELLLATLEQVHKPNRGLMAELCRTWLAVQDAPMGLVVAVCASDTVGVLETTIESGQSFKNGSSVRLLAEDTANNSNNNQESNHG